MRKVYFLIQKQRLNASTPQCLLERKSLRKPKKTPPKICHLVLFFSFHGVGGRALIYDSQLELEKDGRRKTQDITGWRKVHLTAAVSHLKAELTYHQPSKG